MEKFGHIRDFKKIRDDVESCCACPRLVSWRRAVARGKVKRFAHCEYWGKPVPGFGVQAAGLMIVGLAPAAHGANRTGRMFTGDRSGEWLYRALHTFGFSPRPASVSADDGLRLKDCYISAAVRCAPPGNKPAVSEILNCRPFLVREIRLMPRLRVVAAMGKLAFDVLFDVFGELGELELTRRPQFSHGAEVRVNRKIVLLGSYHPSQQNTFTGRLTEPMFHAVFRRAKSILESGHEE